MSDSSTAFEIIRSVTRTMVDNDSVQPALEAIVQLISEKMRVSVCSIYLYQPDTGLLRLTACCGLNRDKMDEIAMVPEEGLAGYIFRTGEVVNIANPSQDSRFKYFPALGEEKLNNFLGIAIPPETRRSVGVLTLQSSEAEPFPPTIEDLAYTLAAQLGTLIENKMLRSPGSSSFLGESSSKKEESPPFFQAQVAFGGIAQGTVVVLKTHQIWDTIYFTESADAEAEIQIFQKALEVAKTESEWLRTKASQIFAEMDARIFETHLLMLCDPEFVGAIEGHIREKMTAPFAVKLATRNLLKTFEGSKSAILAAKSADLQDVALRLINALFEVNDPDKIHETPLEGAIVASVELLPSDLIYLQTKRLLGIICEKGGSTSHAAILARSLGIPCFMGVPGITAYLENGTPVILDDNSRLIYIRPDAHVLREYQRLRAELDQRKPPQHAVDSHTRDGRLIRLLGNISLLSDIELMHKYGLQGVGLYRSEFLFMIRNHFPEEDVQLEVYRQVVKRCEPHEVTIRLLDIGGDKPLRYFDWGKEENPYLGWRSIRMLLARRDIFIPHLRALLRTSIQGNMRILIPMITLMAEVRQTKKLINEVRLELEQEYGHAFPLPPLGAMIEVPSAILQIEAILAEVDFIAIGTNDLIQYLFAVDRGNEKVADYYQSFHPPMLAALWKICAAAKKAGKPVSVCGEMAGDPYALPILLGLGLTDLSIAPAAAETIRDAMGMLDTKCCSDLLQKLLELETAEEVREEVRLFLGRECPNWPQL